MKVAIALVLSATKRKPCKLTKLTFQARSQQELTIARVREYLGKAKLRYDRANVEDVR